MSKHVLHTPESLAREPTIAERLAAYGVRNDGVPGRHDGRRALEWGDRPLGLANAFEAVAVLDLLAETGPDMPRAGDAARNAFVGSGALAVCRRILTVTDTAMSCDEIAVVMAEIAADARQVVSAADAERVAP